MRRFAGDILHNNMTAREKPIVPSFNPEDLVASAELQPFIGDKHQPSKFPGRRVGTGTR